MEKKNKKTLNDVFKETGWCDKCETGKQLLGEVLVLDDCDCCWVDRDYCKMCYLEWLYDEYQEEQEMTELYKSVSKEKDVEIEHLKKMNKALIKTLNEEEK